MQHLLVFLSMARSADFLLENVRDIFTNGGYNSLADLKRIIEVKSAELRDRKRAKEGDATILQNTITTLHNKKSTLEPEVAEMASIVEKFRSINRRGGLVALETENNELIKHNGSMKKKLKKLSDNIASKNRVDAEEKLADEKAMLEEKLKELKYTREMSEIFLQCKEDVHCLLKMKGTQNAGMDYSGEIRRLESEIEVIKENNFKLNEDIKAKKKQRQDLEKNTAELMEEVDKANEFLNNLNATRNTNTFFEQLEKEVKALKDEIYAFKNSLSINVLEEENTVMRRFQKKIEELNARAELVKEEIKEIEDKIEQKKDIIDNFHKYLSTPLKQVEEKVPVKDRLFMLSHINKKRVESLSGHMALNESVNKIYSGLLRSEIPSMLLISIGAVAYACYRLIGLFILG